MRLTKQFAYTVITLALMMAGCKSDTSTQPEVGKYFTVQVGSEQFVMFATDPATIQLAIDNFNGKNGKFPIGKIIGGNAGYNQPWDWHFLPDSIRMTDAAIEVCDGTPSYVNAHQSDFLAVGYCPWSAKVVKVGR